MGKVAQRFVPVVVGALIAASVGIVGGAAPAFAAVTAQTGAAGALAISQALASPTANVTGSSFVATPGGTPDGTSDSALAGFPTDGPTFGILTSGDVNSVPNPGTFASTDDGGGNVRGDTDFDVSILKTDINVPSGANCVAFDFKFLSEEYPNYIGQQYNDGFVAELDNSTWTTSGSAITAPNNFAFDSSGNVVSVNSTGVGGLSPANGAGTAFDSTGGDPQGGATTVLHAATQITAGAHSLYFSIFDQGDQIYDSAVFLDNLAVGFVPNPSVNCAPGAHPASFNLDLSPSTGSDTVGTSHSVTATLTDNTGAPVSDAPIGFTVSGVNPGTGTVSTNDSGQATFSYTGNNPGSDQIAACYDADATPPCEAVASANENWTPPASVPLSVSSSLNPPSVSAGDSVLDTATVTATGTGIRHAVSATLDATGSGGVSQGATTTQGSCAPPSGGTVTCTIGDLPAGSSATIKGLFQTPGTPPEGGTFSVVTTAKTTDQLGSVSSTATANETPANPGQSGGFVPPGGSIQLGPVIANPTNNTVAEFTLPNTGVGDPVTLAANPPPANFCGNQSCRGSVVDLSNFAGYTNPLLAPDLELRFDKSINHGLTAKLFVQKTPGGPIVAIPYCGPRPGWTKSQKKFSKLIQALGFGPHSGYANPSPCIDAKSIAPDGDLIIDVLVLSGDPRIGYH
jgi:Bacterial Ig-like domain (group 1)